MATNVQLSVCLIPVGTPWVRVNAPGFDECSRLTKPTRFNIEFDTDSAQETLLIEHAYKAATDYSTAVIVDSISFFGITSPNFVWAGVYTPAYPEPWASEQSVNLPATRAGQNYLGWNGIYQLTFGVPVFTWIHQVQNLGWIYQ